MTFEVGERGNDQTSGSYQNSPTPTAFSGRAPRTSKRMVTSGSTIVCRFAFIRASPEHGADRFADGGGVDLVARAEPVGEVTYAPFGAVDEDDLARPELLGYHQELLLGTVRSEADLLDPPALLFARRLRGAVGGRGV